MLVSNGYELFTETIPRGISICQVLVSFSLYSDLWKDFISSEMLSVRLLLIQTGNSLPSALPFVMLVIQKVQKDGACIFLGCSAVAAMGDFVFGGLPGEGAHWSLSTTLPSHSLHIDFSGVLNMPNLLAPQTLCISFLSLCKLSPKSSIS